AAAIDANANGSGGSGGSTASGTGGTNDAGAMVSGDAAATPGKTDTLTIMAGGRPRVVIVHSPPNLPAPTALIFNLHGSAGTAAGQEAYSNMDQSADRLGFIAAYAQGDIPSGGGFVWNVPGQPLGDGSPIPAGSADDIAFFATAIASLEQSYPYPIDP